MQNQNNKNNSLGLDELIKVLLFKQLLGTNKFNGTNSTNQRRERVIFDPKIRRKRYRKNSYISGDSYSSSVSSRTKSLSKTSKKVFKNSKNDKENKKSTKSTKPSKKSKSNKSKSSSKSQSKVPSRNQAKIPVKKKPKAKKTMTKMIKMKVIKTEKMVKEMGKIILKKKIKINKCIKCHSLIKIQHNKIYLRFKINFCNNEIKRLTIIILIYNYILI